MKRHPRTQPLALGSLVLWIGACGLATSGLPPEGTSTGGSQTTTTTPATTTTTTHLTTTSSATTGTGGATGSTTSSDTGGTGGTTSSSSSSATGGGGTGTTSSSSTGGAGGATTTTTTTSGSTTCGAGFKACGAACVLLDDPNFGCTATGCDPCVNDHGGIACAAGKCKPNCVGLWDDCNGNPADGCETHIDVDVNNCGACGRACKNTNVAALACSGGVCTSTCIFGKANCNQPLTGNDDGCEKDVRTDNNNCGGCGNVCGNAAYNDTRECDKAGVVQGGVTQNFCGCSNNNECKWGTGTSPTCDNATGLCTCGGTQCQPGEACKSVASTDVCTCFGGAACAAGQSCCEAPAGCFDLNTDTANCGACGHACAPGFACIGGVCSCGATDANCNGGAAAGTFACPPISGPDVCVCNSGATTCANGQRCLADNTCG